MPTARENIERHARWLGIAEMWTVVREGADRIYAIPHPHLAECLVLNQWHPDVPCFASLFHGEGARSFREPWGKHPAMQICFVPRASWPFRDEPLPDGAAEFLDIDIDLSAPVDVVDGVWHASEIAVNKLTGRKTDQARIARMLDARWGKETQCPKQRT